MRRPITSRTPGGGPSPAAESPPRAAARRGRTGCRRCARGRRRRRPSASWRASTAATASSSSPRSASWTSGPSRRRSASVAAAAAVSSAWRRLIAISTRALVRHPREVAQQLQRVGVGPVQVVEHEQHRALGGRLLEQRADGLERAMALARRVAAQPGLRERGQQPRERAVAEAPLALDRRQAVEVALERLDPRLVREQALLVAAPEQHRRALGVHAPRELAEQRRLADPGLAGRDRDPQRARSRRPPTRPAGGRADCSRPSGRAVRASGAGSGSWVAGAVGADASAPHLLDQRARLGARRNPQLAPQPLGELVGHGQRRGPVAGRREQADQVAMRGLAERLVLDARARPRDRLGTRSAAARQRARAPPRRRPRARRAPAAPSRSPARRAARARVSGYSG